MHAGGASPAANNYDVNVDERNVCSVRTGGCDGVRFNMVQVHGRMGVRVCAAGDEMGSASHDASGFGCLD
jgi:hypothetical protein